MDWNDSERFNPIYEIRRKRFHEISKYSHNNLSRLNCGWCLAFRIERISLSYSPSFPVYPALFFPLCIWALLWVSLCQSVCVSVIVGIVGPTLVWKRFELKDDENKHTSHLIKKGKSWPIIRILKYNVCAKGCSAWIEQKVLRMNLIRNMKFIRMKKKF